MSNTKPIRSSGNLYRKQIPQDCLPQEWAISQIKEWIICFFKLDPYVLELDPNTLKIKPTSETRTRIEIRNIFRRDDAETLGQADVLACGIRNLFSKYRKALTIDEAEKLKEIWLANAEEQGDSSAFLEAWKESYRVRINSERGANLDLFNRECRYFRMLELVLHLTNQPERPLKFIINMSGAFPSRMPSFEKQEGIRTAPAPV